MTASRQRMVPILSRVILCILLGAVAAPAFAGFNDPFYTYGKLRVRAARDEIERNMLAEMRPTLSDSAHIVELDDPNLASESLASYRADIPTFSASVLTTANNISNLFNTDAFAGTVLKDTIYFTVDPGTYADGLFASLRGHFSGDIHIDGRITSAAQASWGVVFETLHGGTGGDEHFFGHTPLFGPPDNGSGFGEVDLHVFESFDLTIQILHPGATVTTPLETGIAVALAVGGTDEFLSGPINRAQATDSSFATNDFSATGLVSELVLPQGLDWHSASGVFPASLVTIPLPAAVWMFGAGLAALGAGGRARRARG